MALGMSRQEVAANVGFFYFLWQVQVSTPTLFIFNKHSHPRINILQHGSSNYPMVYVEGRVHAR